MTALHRPADAAGVATTVASDPAAEREIFERDGVVRWDDVLTPSQVIELRQSMENVFNREGVPTEGVLDLSETKARPNDLALLQKIGIWESDPVCEKQIRRPDLVRRVEALLGGPVRLFRDHSFYKPAGKGERSRLVLHQDNRYWHLDPPDAITIWMALDDATTENGCVHYVKGSHRLGRVEHVRPEEGAVLVEALTDQEPVPCPVPAGSALVHSINTLHGSGPNLTDGPRRAYSLVFVRDYVTARGRPMTDYPLAADLVR
ncbi:MULTISPECIES: phytanoyl-CoA dioxygenase family protein [unclassified Streptomyces]|uniref:phytanoyl-CoA dioxygenase family protein n=1 Tax=unclassified Streptomyces TaxID=2593676 RepID=UPI0033D54CD1